MNDPCSADIILNTDRAPRQTTYDLCKIAHKYVENLAQDTNYTYSMAKKDILSEFDASTAFIKTNFDGHATHKDYLIEYIVSEYIKIYATYIAKRITLEEKKVIGNKLRKLAHNAGA